MQGTSVLERSEALMSEALEVIPAGGSSHMRVFPRPIFAKSGRGSKIYAVDGTCYIDYLLAFGALINGHNHPEIVSAIKRQAEELLMCGLPHELEVKLAKKVSSVVPNAEMVLFTVSGTEATMEAIRIARAVTGKTKIVKFEGAYHGHHDYVLWSVEPHVVGLEIAPYRIPANPGVPEIVGKTVIIAPWNDAEILRKILRRHKHSIAAIITEPIMANAGVILPKDEFLAELREICDEFECLLIFDEVITGFRIAPGGAQEYFGVKADLATFGKALGGGVPIAAVTGRREILENVVPGRISFGGTYNAHPISLAASLANLEVLLRNDGEAMKRMHHIGNELLKGVKELIDDVGIDAIVQGLGPLFQIYFTKLEQINNYRDSLKSDPRAYVKFHEELMKRGVLIHHNWGERILLSTQHEREDVGATLSAMEEAFRVVKSRYFS